MKMFTNRQVLVLTVTGITIILLQIYTIVHNVDVSSVKYNDGVDQFVDIENRRRTKRSTVRNPIIDVMVKHLFNNVPNEVGDFFEIFRDPYPLPGGKVNILKLLI